MSKTDFERHLLATANWHQHPKWGVRKDRKTFRLWSNKLWAIEKGKINRASPGHTYKQAQRWLRRILITGPGE